MNDINLRLNSLEKQINLIQGNVNFTLALTWTILGVVVAIIGIALYFLVKMWFNRRFAAEIAKADNKIDNKIKKFILGNPQMIYKEGNCRLLSQNWIQTKAEYLIDGWANLKKEDIIYIDIYYYDNNHKILIDDSQIEILSNNNIKITLINNEKLKYAVTINLRYFILWKNPLYDNNIYFWGMRELSDFKPAKATYNRNTDKNDVNQSYPIKVVCDRDINCWNTEGSVIKQFHKNDCVTAIGGIPSDEKLNAPGWWKLDLGNNTYGYIPIEFTHKLRK